MRRQALWLFVSRGIGSVAQALLLVIFARSVEPTVFGEANVVLGIAVFLGVIADLGLSSYIVRLIAVDQDAERARSALRLNRLSTLTLVCALVVVYLLVAGPLGLSPWLALLVVWVGLEKNIEAQLAVFIAEQNVLVPASSVLIRRLIPIPIYLLVVIAEAPEFALGVALAIGAVLGSIHAGLFIRQALPIGARDEISVRYLIRGSAPFFVTNVSSQARNLDAAVVGLFASTASGGTFAAASKLTVPVFMVTSAIATSVMPAVARGGPDLAKKLIAVLAGSLIVLLGAVAFTVPFSENLITWVFGPAYENSGVLLSMVLAGTLCASIVSPLNALVQTFGGAKYSAFASSVFSVLLLAALAVGAVVDGANGAALGALCVQASSAGVALVLARWVTSQGDRWPAE